MTFTGFYVCPECKPAAVRKLAMSLPIGFVWRKGRQLVALKECDLPARCVKCNGDTAGMPPLKRKLYWHTPLLYFCLLGIPFYCLGLILYVILGIIVRKSAIIGVSLCETHRKRRIIGVAGGVGMMLGFVLCIVATFYWESGWPMAPGVPLLLAGIIWSVVSFRVVVPVRIDSTHVFMTGVSRAFLAELPEWPG
jgi:hypothetical protein